MAKFEKSLYDWCVENDRMDILGLWDYKLNKVSPKDIGYASPMKCYFKCPKGLHKSELKRISNLTFNRTLLSCVQCNFYSFKQWCLDNNHEDWLLLWDYTLNNCSPDEIAYGTSKKYWFKCPRGMHNSEKKCIVDLTSGNTSSLKCNQCESFGQWCLDNDRKLWLDLWDYELNGCSPFDVVRGSNNKYWFKCPKGIHKSEQKIIYRLTIDKIDLKCKQCNSFGQWLIDTFGEDALERYWDYKKNKVNPFEISKSCGKKVWIFCQEKEHHGSYEISCDRFVIGQRCPYCNRNSGKVHPKDSLGQMLIDNYGEDAIERLWSKKNILDPFALAPYSNKKCWFICQNNEEHEDYKTTCNNFMRGQRCPECKESKGEKKIRQYLNTHNIDFIPQKEFPDLLGVSEWKPLSYDFYIPSLNLLIEYQGQFHDGTAKHQTENQFKQQQEHDRRKTEYAKFHNIKLLEIWYWDFNNIETILNENIK